MGKKVRDQTRILDPQHDDPAYYWMWRPFVDGDVQIDDEIRRLRAREPNASTSELEAKAKQVLRALPSHWMEMNVIGGSAAITTRVRERLNDPTWDPWLMACWDQVQDLFIHEYGFPLSQLALYTIVDIFKQLEVEPQSVRQEATLTVRERSPQAKETFATSYEEGKVLDALRARGRPMRTEPLLKAAKLPVTATEESLH